MATIANILGESEKATELSRLSTRVQEAFAGRFMRSNARLAPHCQASYVLALAYDLCPQDSRPYMLQHLVDLVRAEDNHASTGFLATPLLFRVLADGGRADVAYDLLMNDSPPSWLYGVKQGATTIWESLDAITPKGKLKFRSLNHFAFGCVGHFLHSRVAGLDISDIGLGKLSIQPKPGGGLEWAEAKFISVHGTCSAFWRLQQGVLKIEVEVPANTRGELILPEAAGAEISTSNPALLDSASSATNDLRISDLPSGHYSFQYRPL